MFDFTICEKAKTIVFSIAGSLKGGADIIAKTGENVYKCKQGESVYTLTFCQKRKYQYIIFDGGKTEKCTFSVVI